MFRDLIEDWGKPILAFILLTFCGLLLAASLAWLSGPAEATPRLATIALKYNGLHERKHYTRVKRLVGHSPKIPWCSSFTCAVVRKAGYSCPSGYARARSFLSWGKRVNLKNIRKGDVVIFSRGKGKGHNGIFLRWSKGKMVIVSGNSRNRVRVGHYSTSRLLGVRRAL